MKSIALKGAFIYALILALIILLGTKLDAQIISIDTKILLNNKDVELNKVSITFENITSKYKNHVYFSDNFTTFLNVNNEYIITYTYDGFNKKSIYFNTIGANPKANYKLFLTIKLSNKETDDLSLIYYDRNTDNFKPTKESNIKQEY